MEPDRQIEIQLGHMCNNRCVFCVSGQRTADGDAGPTAVEPILERLRIAREVGHRKVTLLGGEPTLQPGFLTIVRYAVEVGFEEIVIFTNGAKTARGALIDEVLATGGRFVWRISIQGATEESHDRTTRKAGSFARILRTLENLRARDQRITVNMCVVGTNHADVDQFPALLARYGVEQLHLDLMRPLDAGRRTEQELRDAMPAFEALAGPMRRMVQGFPAAFDVNLGNLPYCVAPDLAPWIHHDGSKTETIAVDGQDLLSEPWDKYEVKRRDKIHAPACDGCVMRPRCSGVFETYVRFHGLDALQAIEPRALSLRDPGGLLLGVWAPPLLAERLPGFRVRALGDRAVRLSRGPLRLELGPPTDAAVARYARFAVHHLGGTAEEADIAALAAALLELDEPVHPLGPAGLSPRVGAAIARLRRAAPFAGLRWTRIEREGDGVRVRLDGRGEAHAELWLRLEAGRPVAGYAVHGEADAPMVDGLGRALAAVRGARA